MAQLYLFDNLVPSEENKEDHAPTVTIYTEEGEFQLLFFFFQSRSWSVFHLYSSFLAKPRTSASFQL